LDVLCENPPSAKQTPLSRGDFEGMAIINPLLRGGNIRATT